MLSRLLGISIAAISSYTIGRYILEVTLSLLTRKIKNFTVEGVAVDGEAILRIRKQVEDTIIEDMRKSGYVPVIDLLPQLYWSYEHDKNEFSYSITVFGVYVGKKKAREILGILDDRPIKMEKESGD